MGIEAPWQALPNPKDPTDKHSTRRPFSRNGQFLFTFDVHKGAYRKPPKGFTVSWVSRKSNVDIVKAAVEFHLRARRRFGVPQDPVSLELVRDIRDAALATGWRSEERASDDSGILNLERHPERIEPVVVVRKVGSESRARRTFGVPRIGLSRLDYMDRIASDFASQVPNGEGLIEAQIVSPFGVITFEGGLPGTEKQVTFEGRLKIIDPVTSFITQTSSVVESFGVNGNSLTQDEINDMNDKFRKPIIELPNPLEAGTRR